MQEIKSYENFPLWMTLASSLLLSIYAIGAFILAGFGISIAILYLLYCLVIEIRILKHSCVNCYYYGKICGLGRGKLGPLLFKKGDPKKFIEKKNSWFIMLPDFMVVVFPIIGGILFLIWEFSWLLVAILTGLIIIFFGGNAIIRGSIACKYCKQREIGCPADELFSRKK